MKLLIFDCDGTLVDSQHMIVAAMNAAFAASRLAPPPRADVLSVVGLSLEGAITRLLPLAERAHAAEIATEYKGAFGELRKSAAYQEPLYPGIGDMIRDLARRGDIELAIATGKSRRGVAAFLEREGLAGHFSSIQTADTHPSKPHPSMILTALAETGVSAADALMIGDTTFDMEMALAAGVLAVGVGWGYHPSSDLRNAGANMVVEDSLDLGTVLDRMMIEGGMGS